MAAIASINYQLYVLFLPRSMGAGGMDYLELSERIKLCTGGLGSGPFVSEHHSSLDRFQQVHVVT